jgi:hypothetical protein
MYLVRNHGATGIGDDNRTLGLLKLLKGLIFSHQVLDMPHQRQITLAAVFIKSPRNLQAIHGNGRFDNTTP